MDMYVETEMAKVPRKAQQNIHYRSAISEGRPAQQIVELADREKVDVIVMGPARGVVTSLVIDAASRPVVAIPHNEVSSPKPNSSSLAIRTISQTKF